MKVINEKESPNYKLKYFSKIDFLFIGPDQLIKPKLNIKYFGFMKFLIIFRQGSYVDRHQHPAPAHRGGKCFN